MGTQTPTLVDLLTQALSLAKAQAGAAVTPSVTIGPGIIVATEPVNVMTGGGIPQACTRVIIALDAGGFSAAEFYPTDFVKFAPVVNEHVTITYMPKVGAYGTDAVISVTSVATSAVS